VFRLQVSLSGKM